ncbi:hypothetical protein TNCT_468131 [Trichonephila clavata]|uniref:Uncharacterized protein n=1 Tax=Trichonephila clavata TaxID=2740835 RepID=A0A8X6LEW2_TRICU|nr:hypothetical protein TNCT_468131 [Trichonephila clavata]
MTIDRTNERKAELLQLYIYLDVHIRKVVNQPSLLLGEPNLAEIFGSDFPSAWLPFSAMPCQDIVADALSELINMHTKGRGTIIWRVNA